MGLILELVEAVSEGGSKVVSGLPGCEITVLDLATEGIRENRQWERSAV